MSSILNDLKFCVIDLETTGGNPEKDKIIEIGMCHIDNMQVTKIHDVLVNPQMKIPDYVQKLTGISQNEVEDMPVLEDLIDEVIDFIGDRIIVAHNISFDYSFLNDTLEKMGKKRLENHALCTNVMTKNMIPDIVSSNLPYMSDLFNLNLESHHRALDDAKACAYLLITYLNIFQNKNIKKVKDLYYPKNKFELDRIHTSDQKEFKNTLEKVKEINISCMISLKGPKGILLALYPIYEPQKDLKPIEDHLLSIPFRKATIQLMTPFIQGLTDFFVNENKLPEDEVKKVYQLLYDIIKREKLGTNEDIKKIDFIIAKHLIDEQVQVFNFLNFDNKKRLIFKLPTQRKKMTNQLNSMNRHFERHLKKQRSSILNASQSDLMYQFLNLELINHKVFPIERKDLYYSSHSFDEHIKRFIKEEKGWTNFPKKYL